MFAEIFNLIIIFAKKLKYGLKRLLSLASII